MIQYVIPCFGGPLDGKTRDFEGRLPDRHMVPILDGGCLYHVVYELKEAERQVPNGHDLRFAYVLPGTNMADVLKRLFP